MGKTALNLSQNLKRTLWVFFCNIHHRTHLLGAVKTLALILGHTIRRQYLCFSLKNHGSLSVQIPHNRQDGLTSLFVETMLSNAFSLESPLIVSVWNMKVLLEKTDITKLSASVLMCETILYSALLSQWNSLSRSSQNDLLERWKWRFCGHFQAELSFSWRALNCWFDSLENRRLYEVHQISFENSSDQAEVRSHHDT